MGELRMEGPEKEGKGGTLKEGPRGRCKRPCFTEWILRVVLSWCLKLLCGTLRVQLLLFVSTYIPGAHLAIVEHGILLPITLESLPFQRPVSCLLSLPINLEE